MICHDHEKIMSDHDRSSVCLGPIVQFRGTYRALYVRYDEIFCDLLDQTFLFQKLSRSSWNSCLWRFGKVHHGILSLWISSAINRTPLLYRRSSTRQRLGSVQKVGCYTNEKDILYPIPGCSRTCLTLPRYSIHTVFMRGIFVWSS